MKDTNSPHMDQARRIAREHAGKMWDDTAKGGKGEFTENDLLQFALDCFAPDPHFDPYGHDNCVDEFAPRVKEWARKKRKERNSQ